MIKLLNELFELKRTLISDDNEYFFHLINEKIPLKMHSYSSGTKCFDWIIPKKWTPLKGVLKNSRDELLLDISDNILHLLNYSISFYGKLDLVELSRHLYYDKNLPDSIPYRTTYYSKNWGFCLPYNQFKNLPDDQYNIEIETSFNDSELLVGEAILKGQCDKEVVLSSYYCHPMQANDGLSGVILLIMLFNKLKSLEKLNFTYRFFFWPETIGPIAVLSQGLLKPKNVEYALNATTVGYGNSTYYKQTFLGNHSIDNIIEDTIPDLNISSFKPSGSDERQLSSNGVRIPCGVLTTTPYEEYDEYHTSFDNIDLISIKTIEKMVDIYVNVILSYEKYDKYSLNTNGGEMFLTKYNLYRSVGIPGNNDDEIFRNWVLFFCDGNNNIKDIAKKINVSEKKIQLLINDFLNKGVIEKV